MTTPLTPEREAEIRALRFTTGAKAACGIFDTDVEKELYRLAATHYNAGLELLAELGRLRAELALAQTNYHAYRLGAESAKRTLTNRINAVLDMCDRELRNATRWENPIPVPEWVAPVQRTLLGDLLPSTTPEATS